jgi:hypothetical protein
MMPKGEGLAIIAMLQFRWAMGMFEVNAIGTAI